MKKLIANMKEKPELVRKRIAVGASAGVTGLVGLIWIASMVTSNTFALGNTSVGSDQTATTNTTADSSTLAGTGVKSNFSQLLGAVGAATNGTTSKPALTIVDGNTSSSFATTSNPNNQSATNIAF
ncbi:MAG: hypothetical protein JWL75_345 [Parcubacteria group bacterium]|nr:hypothetical protein [Parcubacteria group bacterium]